VRGGGWFSKPQEVVVGQEYIVTMDYLKEDNGQWCFTSTCSNYDTAHKVYQALKTQIMMQDPDRDLVEKAFEEAFLKDKE